MTFFSHSHYRITLLLSALLALLLLLAPKPTQAVNGDNYVLTDTAIRQAVLERLGADAGVSIVMLEVSVDDGVVTLDGDIGHLLMAERAVKLANNVKGVTGVINKMAVLPVSMTDDTIANQIKRALIADPATESWEISVTVDDKIAVLTGNVDSWREKLLASKIARSVRGLKDLENELVVDYETTISDAELEQEIEGIFRWNALLHDENLNVNVSEGVVNLSGTVSNAIAKNIAMLEAGIVGVHYIEAENLLVVPQASDEVRDTPPTSLADTDIHARILRALAQHPRVDIANVTVSVTDGVVILKGIVDNLKARQEAVKTTRLIEGVQQVDNFLRVEIEPALTSEEIAALADAALERDPYTSAYEIVVTNSNGILTLQGEVDTFFEKAQAEDTVSRVSGVLDVKNYLRVQNTDNRLTYDPAIDDWIVYDFGWYDSTDAQISLMPDWELLEEVRDELWWSPFVDSDAITVTVSNGIVTLNGQVESWTERYSATENALEAGALQVKNQLQVLEAASEAI